jgi:hypothetical protein
MSKKERWTNECITEKEREIIAESVALFGSALLVLGKFAFLTGKLDRFLKGDVSRLVNRFTEAPMDGEWDSDDRSAKKARAE